MFTAQDLLRTAAEIMELCAEVKESKVYKSQQFARLTYEDGVLATIRWLFFSLATNPYDISSLKALDISQICHTLMLEGIEQSKECKGD